MKTVLKALVLQAILAASFTAAADTATPNDPTTPDFISSGIGTLIIIFRPTPR